MLFKKERGKWKLIAGLTDPDHLRREQAAELGQDPATEPSRMPPLEQASPLDPPE